MIKNTPTLAIDTSHGNSSIALSLSDTNYVEKTSLAHATQVETLLPMIAQLCNDQQLDSRDIGSVAVTVGPGSFTGIRIGLTVGSAIHLSHGTPLIGISNFQILAFQAKQNNHPAPYHILLDAKRQQYYLQSFTHTLTPLSQPLLIEQHAIGNAINEGSLIACLGKDNQIKIDTNLSPHLVDWPSATDLLSFVTAQAFSSDMILPFTPLYIRPPDAKIPHNSPQSDK